MHKYKKTTEILIALLVTMPFFDRALTYYFNIPSTYILSRLMLVIIPIWILLLFRVNILTVNRPLLLYLFFIFIMVLYLPLNFTHGVLYTIGTIFVFLNLTAIYSIKNKICILNILKYILIIIIPFIFYNLFLSFDSVLYSTKHQFFGLNNNANILGEFLTFSLTIVLLTKGNINKYINLLILLIILYLMLITISRATIISSLPLLYLYIRNINIKYISILTILCILVIYMYKDQLLIVEYFINRFIESDSREHGTMFDIIIGNSFSPFGPNAFHYDMNELGVISDNSYFHLLYNYGLLGIMYLIPFMYFYVVKKDNYLKILALTFFFKAIFENIMSNVNNPYSLLILIVIFIFYNEISTFKRARA